ncbi:MAG: hypothetical protein M3N53_00345 [Actinomycetota bacterium]|nr:hypothetical protein [Actinomycetota bacterium]
MTSPLSRPTVLESLSNGATAVYVAAAFALFFDVVALAGFNQSWERAVVLLVGCIGLASVRARLAHSGKTMVVVFAAVAIALFALRTAGLSNAIREQRQPTIDVGATTIAAVDAQADGRNPYRELLDPLGRSVDPDGSGSRFFGGYKYGPAMIWTFFPAVRGLGTGGLFLVNWLALLSVALIAAAWAHSATGAVGAGAAAALVLAPRFLDVELFVAGVTDLVPVAFGVAGLALAAREREVPAGVLVGLSIATKLLPGLLLAVALLAAARRPLRMIAVIAVTAVGLHVPHLITAPREIFANLVMFNLARPIHETSPLAALPPGWADAAVQVSLLVAVALPLLMLQRGDSSDTGRLAMVIMLMLAIFLLGGKTLNRNYFLWIVTPAAVTVAAKLGRSSSSQRLPEDAAAT